MGMKTRRDEQERSNEQSKTEEKGSWIKKNANGERGGREREGEGRERGRERGREGGREGGRGRQWKQGGSGGRGVEMRIQSYMKRGQL